MNINLRNVGIVLVVFSLMLLITLTWVKLDIDKQAVFVCKAVQEQQLEMEQCPVHKSNLSWLVIVAFAIGFLLLGAGIYLILLSKKTIPIAIEKKEFKQTDISKFDEEEKMVYEILKSKEGAAYQTDLITQTDFSKVKITRILDRLETRGVLERKRRGMTNLIVLK